MAIYTPRGLKIRLSVNHVFALIKRLYPEVDAFRVLKTTEGIESLTSMATFIAALTCFLLKVDPLYIGISACVAYLIMTFINMTGFYIIPGLVMLGTLYSYISGFSILLIALLIVGYFLVGWQGIIAFFIGKFLGWAISQVFELQQMKKIKEIVGVPLTASERSFFNAYRMHASKLGKSLDIDVSDEELTEENWKPAFEDLAVKWPEVVSRFTIE